MKEKLFVIISLLFANQSFAQTSIFHYGYDAAGNRELRAHVQHNPNNPLGENMNTEVTQYAYYALSRGGFISYPDFKENKWVKKSIIIGFKSLFCSFVF